MSELEETIEVGDPQLLQFLVDYDLELTCYNFLIECGYTYNRIKYINNEDLYEIFPIRANNGLRSEFRSKLFLWKAYQTDFSEMYPGKEYNLTNNWIVTTDKLTGYFDLYFKHKYYRQLFSSARESNKRNFKDCIYFMLLHCILKPSVRHSFNEDNKVFVRKATIQDSIPSSILHIKAINDLQYQNKRN